MIEIHGFKTEKYNHNIEVWPDSNNGWVNLNVNALIDMSLTLQEARYLAKLLVTTADLIDAITPGTPTATEEPTGSGVGDEQEIGQCPVSDPPSADIEEADRRFKTGTPMPVAPEPKPQKPLFRDLVPWTEAQDAVLLPHLDDPHIPTGRIIKALRRLEHPRDAAYNSIRSRMRRLRAARATAQTHNGEALQTTEDRPATLGDGNDDAAAERNVVGADPSVSSSSAPHAMLPLNETNQGVHGVAGDEEQGEQPTPASNALPPSSVSSGEAGRSPVPRPQAPLVTFNKGLGSRDY